MNDPDLATVLRQLFECEESWDDRDIVSNYAKPEQVLLSWAALQPKILVVAGEVVLGPLTDDRISELESRLEKNPDKVDLSGYRWIEVPYQFTNRQILSDEQDQVLAQVFAAAWLMHLNAQFPEQNWQTRVIPPDETGSVFGVSFANT